MQEAGEDFGELGDVAGQRVQVGAAGTGVVELLFVVRVEVVGVGHDPSGQAADLGRLGSRRRRSRGGAERVQVTAHGPHAAAVAGGADLRGQRGSVGDPVGQPSVQVRLERVQQFASGTGPCQQFVDADDLPALHSFTTGLRNDHAAVVNGLTMTHNSGGVEGNVNRVKNIKRQMYGRAKFDLLRKRVLLAK